MQTSTDLEELARFLDDSVVAGTEGLIVKTMDSTYEPSRRSAHWLKLKKDYLEGVGDTFDVVPIGAWHGRYGMLWDVVLSAGWVKIPLCKLKQRWLIKALTIIYSASLDGIVLHESKSRNLSPAHVPHGMEYEHLKSD